MIVPALVPSIFGTVSYNDGQNHYDIPATKSDTAIIGTLFPTQIGSSTVNDVEEGFTVDISGETDATGLVDGSAILPYPYHGTKTNDFGFFNIQTDSGALINNRKNQVTFPALGNSGDELSPNPVFIPAGRVYAQQDGSDTEAMVGFSPYITDFNVNYWDDVNAQESSFPYDERFTHYAIEAGGLAELPNAFNQAMDSWSVPVLKSAINTTTVAGVVNLVRTSFATGLGDLTLSSDYDFTLPVNASVGSEVP